MSDYKEQYYENNFFETKQPHLTFSQGVNKTFLMHFYYKNFPKFIIYLKFELPKSPNQK